MRESDIIAQLKARIAADPAMNEPLWAGWNRVCDAIHAYASAARPKMKSFEVHHLTESARLHYVQAVLDGYTFDAAVALVADKFKLDVGPSGQ